MPRKPHDEYEGKQTATHNVDPAVSAHEVPLRM
jgi:hypothetical protein